MNVHPLLKFNPLGGISLGKKTNLPYYVWSYTFNVTILDIIDKCHDRTNDLKILCLPEVQPIPLVGPYSRYKNDWSNTKVDVIYSGYENYETERIFYQNDLCSHLNPNRHFFTLYFLYTTFNNYQYQYHKPPILNYNPIHHFTSYNRSFRPHRHYLLQLMYDNKLLDNNLYTLFEFNKSLIHYFNMYVQPHFDFTNFNVPLNELDSRETINSGNYFNIFPSFTNSAFQQVTETLTEPIFLTEKTFIPILAKKAFITYGAQNINNVLTNFGFKLYDNIFDYSFDIVSDKNIRAQEYVKELKRVCDTYSPSDIYEKTKDIAIYNYNVALDILKNEKHIPCKFYEWEKEHRDDNVWRYHMSDWYYNYKNNINNYL
jgi:hypothetical protein